jgi:hypothetical protein
VVLIITTLEIVYTAYYKKYAILFLIYFKNNYAFEKAYGTLP